MGRVVRERDRGEGQRVVSEGESNDGNREMVEEIRNIEKLRKYLGRCGVAGGGGGGGEL